MVSDAALAGSVLCLGFAGASPADAPLDELRELAPAGTILFARNVTTVERTRELAAALRVALGPELFVAIDQEGGRVARLRSGVRAIPSMMAVGACDDEGLAERLGAAIARDLRAAGLNLDLAPVLDLALEAANGAIGTRSFGDDPARVAALGCALARGLENAGVGATFKHFPGHGATPGDSHVELPVVSADAALLRARDLVPFAAAIGAGARAVMAAHVVVTAFDPERPASLSPRVLHDLLRTEYGFAGVCFSDALEMDAVARERGIEAAATAALAAGVDCLVLGTDDLRIARGVRDAIVAALARGELERTRLAAAAARVQRLRAELTATADRAPAGDEDVGALIARRAITVVRGTAACAAGEALTVVSFEGTRYDGAAGAQHDGASLSLALRRRRVSSESLRVPLAPDDAMLEQLLDLIGAQPERRLALVMRRAHLHAAQRRALDALLAVAPDALVVSALEPFDVACVPAARNVVCCYGDDEATFEALADVLTGRCAAQGKLPVALERVAR